MATNNDNEMDYAASDDSEETLTDSDETLTDGEMFHMRYIDDESDEDPDETVDVANGGVDGNVDETLWGEDNALHNASLKKAGERGASAWRMSLDEVKAVIGKWMDAQWVLMATLGVPWTASSVKRRRTKHDKQQTQAATATPDAPCDIDEDMHDGLRSLVGETVAQRKCLPFRNGVAKGMIGLPDLRKEHPQRTDAGAATGTLIAGVLIV
ncbi:hypothetical protein CYMTET_21331 [Cymbomonas tetramitiformis]|uniref:Uncharacterized protein n=2 Tax=Cymbomonas tetramitiformis TaxID=36881 RepID=A0AAE0FMS6_9CHLO|nr:hypothetical protein CYMTET_28678 [Cymbomonas tetramitiformis]KAK3270263.1 hypothetical protein CYMTET_21331 [Cymbomonas tetramitiformis]